MHECTVTKYKNLPRPRKIEVLKLAKQQLLEWWEELDADKVRTQHIFSKEAAGSSDEPPTTPVKKKAPKRKGRTHPLSFLKTPSPEARAYGPRWQALLALYILAWTSNQNGLTRAN